MNETAFDFSGIDDKYYCNEELGAVWTKEETVFRIWSPEAEKITLNLYGDCKTETPFSRFEMNKNKKGLWEHKAQGDLNGVYYTYSVLIKGAERETIDIYAKSAGVNGKRGMIFDPALTNPEGWEKTSPVNTESVLDAVIYELHVRDFSSDENASFKARGKFSAFCEENVKNQFGGLCGLNYIKELGITHIHLLPVFDYASVDESMEGSFNWGYDPLNFNAPEGSYSTSPYDGFARVRELKRLIMTAHSKGMGIIADVVYNHTYDTDNSPFSLIFPHYYYRHENGNYSNGSGCGNEIASERLMAGKFICDSLCYLLKEYKLDGFRFDLMGLIDIKTLNFCAKKLKEINPYVILYGEGWTGGVSSLPEKYRAVKKNARMVPDYSMFSDDFRDCVKGSVFDDNDQGFINGKAEKNRELMKSVIAGGVYHTEIKRNKEDCFTDNPSQSVNYTESHDNLTFYDKLRVSMKNSSEDNIIAADKMGAALVFLSQGVPFIQAGQEFLRSKNFVHNSYNSPDCVNQLKWNNITIFADMVDYYKGLIKIRKRYPIFRLKSAEEIREKIHFEDLENGAFIAYIGGFSLIVNPSYTVISVNLKDNYYVFADKNKASDYPLYPVSGNLEAAPLSVILLGRC